ncbi:MAG: FkbM family methyltransferase [Nitrospirae bacterium]|nr:FkbM family methyltransferase [Nitrospirota bacterium]
MSNYKEALIELFKQPSVHNNSFSYIDLLRDKKIIVYGAGGGAVSFFTFVLRRYGLKAQIVLDRKFQSGDFYLDVPSCAPFEYQPTEDEKIDAIVVVTVITKQYQEEIFKCLKSMGFRNIILSSDIYEYHLLHPPTELIERGFDYYLDNKEKILSCLDIFSDNLSSNVFVSVVETHIKKSPTAISISPMEEQYFPRDINLSKGYSRFINCGAYNGDTVLKLNALYGKIDLIVCFEPDSENFGSLSKYLSAKHSEIAQSVMAFPCGVFSHETQLRFSCGDKVNSAISDEGDSVVQCVSLDHVIPGCKPTFIQMDVEGAELEALKGAEALLKENKPDLAICVYHAPNHIWDIPLYLESLCLGYVFYLRNYTSFVAETVLYATVPKE